MDDKIIAAILKQHDVYVTHTRLLVFKVMQEHKGTINVSELHKLTAFKLNRISVYRTLQLFLKKGLIFYVPDPIGWPKYIIKDFSANRTILQDTQAYYLCEECGVVQIIELVKDITDAIPMDLKVNSCQIILEGKCIACETK